MNKCSFCKSLCCKEKLITINIFDALRIKKNLNINIEKFASLELPRILNLDEKSLLFCKERKERFPIEYVLAIKSRPCIFLDNEKNKCNIYSFSPLTCRVYPFSENGKMIKNPRCPEIPKLMFHFFGIDKKQELLKKVIEENKNYIKIVKKWNNIKGTKKQCIKFLEKEAERFFY